MKWITCFLVLGIYAVASAFSAGSRYPCRAVQPSRLFQAATAAQATQSCDVAVFGGGFGGLYTALAISREARLRNKELDVALVEPTDSFVFLPLLYDLTVGTATEVEVCPFYNDLLRNTGVRHIQGSLETISPSGTAVVQTTQVSDSKLTYRAGVIAVGASPERILERVPGATEFAQPFYTAQDAKATRRLLKQLEEREGEPLSIAIVGGGFGGVELAASVKRRFKQSKVTLLSKGAPMAGTRAELLVDKALEKIGVRVVSATVDSIEGKDDDKLIISRTLHSGEALKETYDSVLWTAGSGPADPVPAGCIDLKISQSGRLAVDSTLRCMLVEGSRDDSTCLWALGDCAEMYLSSDQSATPRTAQAAMQQAEIVASNVISQLYASPQRLPSAKTFVFQDLGSMLTLGGPNGAILAPRDGALAPAFAPLLDTIDGALGAADEVVSSTIGRSPTIKKLGLSPETLGLSLGSHGIGVNTDGAASGTFAGTLSGAARRAVYAVRMPTNEQRAVSFVSAAISTAASLAKEASDRRNEEK